MALRVSRGAADGLDQGGLRTQEALLVRVQDGHQGDLRNVQPLSQQVDAHQNVEHIQTHVPDDLGTLQRIDVGMQIFDPDPDLPHIIGQVLRHPLGQRGHQHLIVLPGFLSDLSDQIVDLSLHGPDRHLRIQKPGGTDDLLHPVQLMRRLVLGRRGGHEQHLIDVGFKLFKIQRPVVQRGGQPEAVVHQRGLPGTVSREHAADLRDRHMGLVHDDQKIIREKVQQRHGRLSRRGAVQVAGIVLDPGAEARFPQHLDVKIRPFRDPLRLDQLILPPEVADPLLQLLFYIITGNVDLILGNHIMRRRKDRDMLQRGDQPSA